MILHFSPNLVDIWIIYLIAAPKIPAPPDTSSHSWMSLLATTGLPKVGSMGFTGNYMSDTIPPPSYNFEESNSQSNSDGLQMKIFHPFSPDNAPKLMVINPDMEVVKDSGTRREPTLIDLRKNFRADGSSLSATVNRSKKMANPKRTLSYFFESICLSRPKGTIQGPLI